MKLPDTHISLIHPLSDLINNDWSSTRLPILLQPNHLVLPSSVPPSPSPPSPAMTHLLVVIPLPGRRRLCLARYSLRRAAPEIYRPQLSPLTRPYTQRSHCGCATQL